MYEYDFTDGWQHDVRVERMLPLDPVRIYRVCGGRRAVPPEDCGGPWAFLELRQRYSIINTADPLMELVERRLVIGGEAFVHDHYEGVLRLLRWLEIDRFDRLAASTSAWLNRLTPQSRAGDEGACTGDRRLG